jgi:hypothetical protein
MNYLARAISAIVSKPRYILLFILFNLSLQPISMLKASGAIQGAIVLVLSALTVLLSTYLIAGVYSAAWKNIKNEPASVLAEARKYFFRILAVYIIFGIIYFIAFIPFAVIHKTTFYKSVPAALYNKTLDAHIVRTVPIFLISTLLLYAFPGIVVADLTSKKALSKALRFIISHLPESKFVIVLLLLSYVMRVIFIQWAVRYDYSSSNYWQIMTVNNTLTYGISFIAFLAAAQIFNDSLNIDEQKVNN